MKSRLGVFVVATSFVPSLLLCFLLLHPAGPAWASTSGTFGFENADIAIVVKEIGRVTGTTFLFDPEQVKGKITLHAPKPVSPAEALELLKSALALHGYALVPSREGTWIVPAERVAQAAVRIEVVPLNYARAGELAYTLSRAAPWLRIVPYYPTNSLIISGHPDAVEELIGIIK